MEILFGFNLIDIAALVLFAMAWIAFEIVQHRPTLYGRSLTFHMNQYRVRWMNNMVRRGPEALDALVQTSLLQGVGFFASTSIIVIGALLAGLGASEQAILFLQDLPLAVPTTRAQWEIKIMLLLFTFVFAFFKFAWSLRLFNYVTILVAGSPTPDKTAKTDEMLNDHAARLAKLHALAAGHFTAGINAYFFALAAIAWFLNPWFFIIATLWVSMVLYRRTFHSKFMRILSSKNTSH